MLCGESASLSPQGSWMVIAGCAQPMVATPSPQDENNFKYTLLVPALCLVAQSCPTLCNPMTAPRQAPLSIGILQARILEWVAMPFSRGSSQSRASNPGLPQCWWFLYQLSHHGSPVSARLESNVENKVKG